MTKVGLKNLKTYIYHESATKTMKPQVLHLYIVMGVTSKVRLELWGLKMDHLNRYGAMLYHSQLCDRERKRTQQQGRWVGYSKEESNCNWVNGNNGGGVPLAKPMVLQRHTDHHGLYIWI